MNLQKQAYIYIGKLKHEENVLLHQNSSKMSKYYLSINETRSSKNSCNKLFKILRRRLKGPRPLNLSSRITEHAFLLLEQLQQSILQPSCKTKYRLLSPRTADQKSTLAVITETRLINAIYLTKCHALDKSLYLQKQLFI